jgi:hypothetical protein
MKSKQASRPSTYRLSGLCAVLAISAAPAATTLTDEDLLLSRAPVVIKSRVSVGGEYTELDGGGHREKFRLGAGYGFGFNGHDRNFGIGIELPYLWNEPETGDSGSGFGDVKVRVGHVFLGLPEGWRAGWFFETEFDTAASDVFAIANQRTQMAAGTGAVIPVTDRLAVSTSVSYGWSLENGPTTGRKGEWEAHVTAIWKPMARTSLSLDYKAVINTVDGTELFNTLEPGLGITFGPNDEYGLSSSLEIPLDNTGTDWVAKIGIARFF